MARYAILATSAAFLLSHHLCDGRPAADAQIFQTFEKDKQRCSGAVKSNILHYDGTQQSPAIRGDADSECLNAVTTADMGVIVTDEFKETTCNDSPLIGERTACMGRTLTQVKDFKGAKALGVSNNKKCMAAFYYAKDYSLEYTAWHIEITADWSFYKCGLTGTMIQEECTKIPDVSSGVQADKLYFFQKSDNFDLNLLLQVFDDSKCENRIGKSVGGDSPDGFKLPSSGSYFTITKNPDILDYNVRIVFNMFSIIDTTFTSTVDASIKLGDKIIGLISNAKVSRDNLVDGYHTIGVPSTMPYMLLIGVPDAFGKPYKFAYGGDEWTSEDKSRVSVGGFDAETRTQSLDTSFTVCLTCF